MASTIGCEKALPWVLRPIIAVGLSDSMTARKSRDGACGGVLEVEKVSAPRFEQTVPVEQGDTRSRLVFGQPLSGTIEWVLIGYLVEIRNRRRQFLNVKN